MSKKDTKSPLRIAGTVTTYATHEPVPEISVTVVASALPKSPNLGRALTDKNGHYEVKIKPEKLKRLAHKADKPISVVLRLSDANGRTILTTTQPVLLRRGASIRADMAAPYLEHGLAWPDMTYIAGQPVNLVAAARLTAENLVQAYLYLRKRTKKLSRSTLVRRALPGLFVRPKRGDDCAEGRLEVIRFLLAERGRETDLDEVDADDFPAGTTIHEFYTPKILVKYTTDAGSIHRVDPTVPATDAPRYLRDGTTLVGNVHSDLADLQALDPANTEVAPTWVQEVGLIAEYALTQYLTPAFGVRDPRAGAARMEYRILEQGVGYAGGTSPSWSHIEVDPGNSYDQNLNTTPHELFHQVQYRYNSTTSRSGIYGLIREGGARLVEDCLDDLSNRYVDNAQDVFNDPTQSIVDSPSVGTVVASSTPIKYGLGLFWKHMAEQHSTITTEPVVGFDAYRKALEASATVEAGDPGIGYDPPTLRTARNNMTWYGSFDQFFYYDPAQTELGCHETTWANYLIANYLHGTASPTPDARFDYLEDDEAVTWAGSPVAHLADLQAAVLAGDSIALTQGASVARNVVGFKAWASRYYRITPSGVPGPRLLRVNFNAAAGMTDPLLQILLLGPGNALVDIHRSDKAIYSKTVNMDGLSAVVVIAASRANPGDFGLQFDEVAAASDTMITRWNSAVGTEYETDPHGWSWTWISPDVMVDNDSDDLADTTVYFSTNNTLKVRLRNRGNQAVGNIQIDFWYQKATPFLTSAGWVPLQNAALVTQQLTGQSLAAKGDATGNDVKWFSVDWAPVDDGTHHPHWCVKVLITVPGEPNNDNKMALCNFANVIPDSDDDVIGLLERLPELRTESRILVIPRGPRWTFRTPSLDKPSAKTRKPVFAGEPTPHVLMPSRVRMANLKLRRCRLVEWDRKVRQPKPQPGRFYRVDPRTLPPGVNPETLVTVAQSVDGRVTGGVTFQISLKDT
ncbi:MAG: hypothetical protein A2Y79_00825 [Deltaproteobacteria bacterium RBG_13_43_22]|nr:MAG: hypothetical protein A2Y79_00825 [Deltaproteobacteria bacterium RBG_13_43_22]